MLVRDPEIFGMILRLAEHFTKNVATGFTRPLLSQVLSDPIVDRRIFDLTERPMDIAERGIPIDELYLQINAMALFINDVRSSVIPSMRSSVGTRSFGLTSANDPQKIYRDMALSNFAPNISILEKYTRDLFDAVIRFDKNNSKGKKLMYEKITENFQTEELLQA